MTFTRSLPSRFAFGAFILATALGIADARRCYGTTVSALDTWCNSNCNHSPPYCPPNICSCDPETPTPTTTTSLSCRTTPSYSFLTDAWCTSNCNHSPPFCPPSMCQCGDPTVAPDLYEIEPYAPSCCTQDSSALFFGSGDKVLKKELGSSDPVLCYNLNGGQASSIVFDSQNNMYVADWVGAVVYRMSPNCDPASVEVLTSWTRDGIIDRPTGLVIIPGESLLISATIGVYEMTFNQDGSVYHISQLSGIGFFIRSMFYLAGKVYFIQRDAEVLVYDVSTETVTTYLAVHDLNLPDYGGLAINECGLFLSVTDANQIYFCPDLSNPSSCRLYCNVDATLDNFSCTNIVNPMGIASGCCCDIYVASSGTGCIVALINVDEDVDAVPGPYTAENVVCGLDLPLAVAFYSPPRDSEVCTDLCEIDVAPTILPDTPSPTESSSPSSSASRTSSPSSSRSPSPSATPSPSRRLGRLVPGANLPASGGVTQAGVITGTASTSLFLCDVGQPLFACGPNADNSNSYLIPTNKLEILSQESEPFRAEKFPVYMAALTKAAGMPSTMPFNPSCLFHVTSIRRSGASQIPCDATCYSDASIGLPRADNNCVNGQDLDVSATRDRVRNALNNTASVLGVPFNAFGTTPQGQPNVPDNLILPASARICENDVIGEFSVSILQLGGGTPVSVTVATQPRFDLSSRCDATKTQAERLCFLASPYFASVFGGVEFGETNGYVCVQDFILDGTELRDGSGRLTPDGFKTPDTIMALIAGDIADVGFFVNTRSTGCPQSIPSQLCAASSHRICHINECA